MERFWGVLSPILQEEMDEALRSFEFEGSVFACVLLPGWM
jgi:hypothetical protein